MKPRTQPTSIWSICFGDAFGQQKIIITWILPPKIVFYLYISHERALENELLSLRMQQ